MQKVCCFMMAIMLLVGMAMGSLAEETTATERLIEDWVTLLYMQDDLLTQENYALGRLTAFRDDPTWENLVYARTAIGCTCKLAEHYAATEAVQTMTPEDFAALTAQGMDVGDLQAEFTVYNSTVLPEMQNVTVPAWNGCYKAEMMEMAFDRYSMESLTAAAQAEIRYNDCTLRYLYLVTNYLLLALPEADAARLEALARLNAPGAMGMYDAAFTSANDVLNEMNAVVKQTEEALLDSEKATALMQADMDAMQQRVDNGETVVPPENCLSISGLPTLLPWPDFWDSELSEITYYWLDAAGNSSAPTRRMEMTAIPNAMYAEIPSVTLAEHQAYVQRLSAMGCTPADTTDTSALFMPDGETKLILQWKDGTEVISIRNGQVCFAADWYVQP